MIQLMIGQDLATNLTISSTVTELEDKLDEDELFYRFNTVRPQRSPFRLRERVWKRS